MQNLDKEISFTRERVSQISDLLAAAKAKRQHYAALDLKRKLEQAEKRLRLLEASKEY